MTLGFSVVGQDKLMMFPYVKEIIDDFTKQTGDLKMAATLTVGHQFKNDKDAM